MLIGLGILAVVVLVFGAVLTLRLARAQTGEGDGPSPPSSDFVAPVSSDAFRFRKAEESAQGFRQRVENEKEEIAISSRRGGG